MNFPIKYLCSVTETDSSSGLTLWIFRSDEIQCWRVKALLSLMWRYWKLGRGHWEGDILPLSCLIIVGWQNCHLAQKHQSIVDCFPTQRKLLMENLHQISHNTKSVALVLLDRNTPQSSTAKCTLVQTELVWYTCTNQSNEIAQQY